MDYGTAWKTMFPGYDTPKDIVVSRHLAQHWQNPARREDRGTEVLGDNMVELDESERAGVEPHLERMEAELAKAEEDVLREIAEALASAGAAEPDTLARAAWTALAHEHKLDDFAEVLRRAGLAAVAVPFRESATDVMLDGHPVPNVSDFH